MQKFTTQYLEAKKEFEIAKLNFEAKSSVKTATKLGQARAKMNSVQKLTDEFIAYCDSETIKDMKEALNMPVL